MLEVEGSTYPVIFLAQDRAMRHENKGCLVFWVGLLLVGPGDQGLLLGLTVLFPVLLRLPPVGYEPKLGSLRFVFRL